uniref:R2D2 n=1 Tax=Nilaparvata lugens TaxID=108931 RepID=M4QL28_NILLU|nr:R2D2 [Nilaparvata lugens]
MSSKTPVSTLHELFVVKGITPYYNLVVNGVGSHNPVFKYRLECGDIVSHGTGKSKKEAKHDAAQNALNQLKNNGLFTEELQEQTVVDEANIPVASPYQDVLKENVVGTLTALCTSNRISEPVYELIGEEGPPHSKTFTIQCSVLHLKEVAQARTKKQAKHKSSKQMIDKLQQYCSLDFTALEEDVDGKPPNTQTETTAANKDFNEEIEQVKNKYAAMQKTKPMVENLGLRISDYHTVGTDCNSFLLHPNFENIKSININEIEDPYAYVLTLLEGTEIELVWEDMPSLPSSTFVYSKCAMLYTSPNWTFTGLGATEAQALKICATEMLKFFQTLLI